MLKKPHYMALAIVGLLALIVLNLPAHTAGRLKLAVGGLFLPLFGLSRASHQLAGRAGDALLTRSELIRQLDQLRRTNQDLEISAMQAAAISRENDQLRQLVEWQRQSPWKLKLANVIARDPANWWQTIQIDVGSRDGVQVDMAVLTTDGLVGRVSSVNPYNSQVALVGNPNCKVSAIIESTRETGVILGAASPLDNSLVTMSYLSANSSLKPGSKVTTSGLGGIFRPGIVVGQIAEDAHVVDFGLMTETRVKLAANLGALEEVWVLFQ
jgi:rod shape-determining protein MreC